MSRFQVCIPGIAIPYETSADSDEDALCDALLFHGLSFVPPGTTVNRVAGRND